jgi:hypothetical protein
MRTIFFLIYFFIFSSSFSQGLIWKQYIDDDNKNEEFTYIHTHHNNRYIFSSTENYSGSSVNKDYISTLTKTTLGGDILWTKSYRPGGSYYKQFTLSDVFFKDTLILIYGSCLDTVEDNLKFIFELNTNGETKLQKILQNVEYIYHVNYSDSNTIQYIYSNEYTIRKVYSESYNIRHELVQKDSFNTIFDGSYYIINNSKIYLTAIYKNINNRLCIRLNSYQMNWNLLSSDSLISEVIQQSTPFPLYIYPKYKKIIDNNILEISGMYNYSGTENDYYYFSINLNSLTFKENFYFKKIFNSNYSVNGSSVLYKQHNSSCYSLYKIYNKDSLINYKCNLVKFSNNLPIWNVNLFIPNNDSINIASKLVSLDFINDKILATIGHRQSINTFVQFIIEYDTNGNYLRSYEDTTDSACLYTYNLKTIFNNENEILSLAHGKLKGRNDYDIIWKKTSFLPAGLYNELMNTTNPPYPNPTNDILYLNCEVCSTIRVYDLYGKLALEANHTDVVQLAELPPGIYFVHLTENNQRSIFKVVKNQ